MTSRQTAARQTAARQTSSPSFEIGYGKPPQHTQFQKGRSGNPGGRPRRRDMAGELKALTLQEAFRGIVIRKDGGIPEPMLAIQAVLRSQMEAAIRGNVRAQRDILSALRAYEREDVERAAVNEHVDELMEDAEDAEEVQLEIRDSMNAAPTAVQKANYVEAAQWFRDMLRRYEAKSAGAAGAAATKSDAKRSGTVAGGAAEAGAKQRATRERAAARERAVEKSGMAESGTARPDAVPSAPLADGAPQPKNRTPAAPHAAAPSPPPPAAAPGASPAAEPRPGRHARHRTGESAPAARAGMRARLPRVRCLRGPAKPAAKTKEFPVTFPVLRESVSADIPSASSSGAGRTLGPGDRGGSPGRIRVAVPTRR
jgi:hypothetical protein